MSLVEMLLATSVMIVGMVGVAQLVPASMLLNSGNRARSASLVLAQRQLDTMMNQPLLPTATFPDLLGNACPCLLGDPSQPNVLLGSAIVVSPSNQPLIDFSQAKVPGYSYATLYVDPNDPTQAQWDVRWAVITQTEGGVAGGVITSRRFIVGALPIGGSGFVLPVTLDSMVAK